MLGRETIVVAVLTLFFSLGMFFVAFSSYQQSIMRQDINQDGVVNNQDYLESFRQGNSSEFAEVYSQAFHDPSGDGVWDEEDKEMIVNAWKAKEGEKRYDLRADLYPDGIINEVDMHMAQVEEKSQGQWLSNPLQSMNDLVRRIGWAGRFGK